MPMQISSQNLQTYHVEDFIDEFLLLLRESKIIRNERDCCMRNEY